MNNSIKMLSPFVLYCQKVIPLAFDESMSYYECLCALYSYLKDTVVPAVNNNAEALEEVQQKMVELKEYVDNYFENLDVQTEINNKLDEMAEQGELAEIITAYLEVNGVLAYDTIQAMSDAENIIEGSTCYTLGKLVYNDGEGAFYKVRQLTSGDTVDGFNIVALDIDPTLIAERMPNSYINNLQTELDTLETNVSQKPLYNVLENGGYDDGLTDNTSVLSGAYSNGFYRFYFPQNDNKNAQYYFSGTADFTNYEIITDEGVILSFDNIDSVRFGKYLTNVKVLYKSENQYSLIPKNESDLFNSCLLGINYNKINLNAPWDVGLCQLVIYDYSGDGKFKTSPDINTYYTNDTINYKLTASPGSNAVCLPVTDSRNCVETNALMSGTLNFIICDTTSGAGIYGGYDGSTFWAFNEQKTSYSLPELNLHKHNKPNNNFAYPMSYKIKYNKIVNTAEIYINNSLVSCVKLNFTPNYFGFGTTTPNAMFTRICHYYQEHVPMNYKLNILVAGDSRFDPRLRSYQIEEILKNSLKYNAINDITIDNKSYSGYTLNDINTVIQNEPSDKYDIVIIEGGINNYNDTANTIANTTAGIISYCKNNGIIPILTTCMPTAESGSDPLTTVRSQQYYKIVTAMNIGFGDVPIGKLVDNMNGSTISSTANSIMPDGVHPTNLGLIEIAKGITEAILTLQ